MDIIFKVDFTNNKIEASFCGIDDRTLISHYNDIEKKTVFTFAIRFYAWGAALFAEESMRNTKNAFFSADCHFTKLKSELEKHLFDVTDIYNLIPIAEKILLKHLQEKNRNQIVFQTVSEILKKKGNLLMPDLKREVLSAAGNWKDCFSNISVFPLKVWHP